MNIKTFLELIDKTEGDLPDIKWIHLSNMAIESLEKDERRVLSSMYEDSNVGPYEKTRQHCLRVEKCNPGAHVWVETGDYIFGDLNSGGQDTYDAWYRLIAIKRSVWDKVKEKLEQIDFEWRCQAHAKISGQVHDRSLAALPYDYLQIAQIAPETIW